jgi:predicted lipoprotein with Yx(FWY)xxD motif
MKKHLIAGAIVAAALALLAGCGSDDDPEEADTNAGTTEETADDATDDSVVDDATDDAAFVGTTETELGEVLVDEAGLTLYGFTEDTDGVPTCEDACADAWPPVLVDSAELPAGLDAEVYSVVERSDGTFQLVAGEWPLYRFAGDAAEGDVNGQGTGGVWFAAAPGGSLITGDEAPADEAPAAEETTTTAAGGYDY